MYTSRIVVLFSLLFLTTCSKKGGNGHNPFGPNPNITSAPPGEVAVRIDSARQNQGGSFDQSLRLSVTIFNGKGNAPIALNPMLFSVRLNNGLLLSPEISNTREYVDNAGLRLGDDAFYPDLKLAFKSA